MTNRSQRRHRAVAVGGMAVAALVTGCTAGAGGFDTSEHSINVLMVNNPQMMDLQALTAEHFTAETGITVNFTVLPENDLRDKASSEFANQAGQYDIATLSNFEIPIYGRNGWLTPLNQYTDADVEFDQSDIFPAAAEALSVDGTIYGEPFYGESSFLMYRTDVFEEAGIEMSDRPTWDEVAEAAATVDTARDDMAGICLRGQPGWGQVIAPLTTVVNTFGGTWFEEDWTPAVDSPEFTEAVQFYVDLVREHGEAGAPSAGFTECLNAMISGQVSMWYDATSAAGSLEAEGSPIAGNVGYAQAPVVETDSSGWLFLWSWAMQARIAEEDPERAADAWEFISWASSAEYEALVGDVYGWERAPAGKRQSTYENPDYLDAAGAFAEATRTAILEADPNDPGVQTRPAPGIQFVGIPEFTDLGTKFSQYISSAIAGRTSVPDALAQGQTLAQRVADTYQED
ncbi:ABC transporter substrate-binding protein [Pseudactinotalea suaedae]|uniref:ABC transporter substrate-binding protein n=1 Tax=Pseudactinotalea suaedae TaxID=1524924 RepID=UPI0012E18759|nr:sugar ABC transporter substrate-binding protein [Pseudactinotalea suaedae]